jgi:hypothetical protein
MEHQSWIRAYYRDQWSRRRALDVGSRRRSSGSAYTLDAGLIVHRLWTEEHSKDQWLRPLALARRNSSCHAYATLDAGVGMHRL